MHIKEVKAVTNASASVTNKKILITYYNGKEKANLFCKFVSENYSTMKATIEQADVCDLFWVYLHLDEDVAVPCVIVMMVQAAIESNPTLSIH